MDQKLLSPQELAEFLGVSIATISRWQKEGRLPAHSKLHRVVRFDRDKVLRWLEENEQTVTQEREVEKNQ